MTQSVQRSHGNPIKGTLVLTGILLALFWFPLVGPFVAGVVGGLKSGSLPGAVIAWAIPTSAIAVLVLLLTVLSPMGANIGVLAVVTFHMFVVLAGAVLGGIGASGRE